MSVLIKGMKMPKNCVECPLAKNYGMCAITKKTFNWGNPNRLSDCPLIEILPHGRLIDEQWLKDAMITTLEALKKNPKMDKQEMHLIAAFDTLRAMLNDAPTIIEVEDGT